jgi:hypothetical protein
VARVCKDNDGQATQRSYRTLPGDEADVPIIRNLVCCKVVDDQNDEIANRNQGNHARVLERIEFLREAQRYNEEQEECRYPELALGQERITRLYAAKRFCHARHQVANDDHVRDANAKAFYGNGGIKHHGGVRVRYLGERKK